MFPSLRTMGVFLAAGVCCAAVRVEGGTEPACPGEGSCFEAHAGPGCEFEDCCLTVCDMDSFCCVADWDESCASIAVDSCDIGLLCPGEGDCYAANGTAGCANTDCCSGVCGIMPDCCLLEWTQECADLAFPVCPCGAPGAGDCFEVHEGQGCDDQACCGTVCGLDGFCCSSSQGEWDEVCVIEADFCGAPSCELICPPGATQEPEFCQALTNEGCNIPLVGDQDPPPPLFTPMSCGQTVCGTAFAQFTRDTDWYEVTVATPTQLTWTVTSEFPGSAMIVEGDCDSSYAAVAEAFPSDCGSAAAVQCLPPGTYYLFVSTAIPERTLRRGAPCPACDADLNGDGMVGPNDLAVLLGAWGPQPEEHIADINADGDVGPPDLAALLGSWGHCPQPDSALWSNDYIATLSCTPCTP